MNSLYDWLDAVRFRWKMIALFMAGAALLGAAYIAMTPHKYVANASLLIDQQQPAPVDPNKNDKPDSRSLMATQADLVQSPTVAGQAAVLAKLSQDPRYVAEWTKQTNRGVPFEDWCRNTLLGAISVVPGKDTNVLEIFATSSDPWDAARIANSFAQSAVLTRYRLRTQPAKTYAAWLESRLAEARSRMLDSQNKLSDFVRRTGMSQGEDLSSQGSQVAGMAGQLATAESRAAAAGQSNFSASQAQGQAQQSEAVQQLRTQVATKQAELSRLQALFGPDYPDVKRAQAELQSLQANLNSAIQTMTTAYAQQKNAESAAERAAAEASQRQLRAMTSQEQARLQSMGVNVAAYTTLKNDYAAAQRSFNDLDQHLGDMRLQSAVPQSDVQVLDTASPFRVSSSPDARFTLVLAAFFGLLVGVAAAILLELMRPRVRTWNGVERILGIAVIGRVALPSTLRRVQHKRQSLLLGPPSR